MKYSERQIQQYSEAIPFGSSFTIQACVVMGSSCRNYQEWAKMREDWRESVDQSPTVAAGRWRASKHCPACGRLMGARRLLCGNCTRVGKQQLMRLQIAEMMQNAEGAAETIEEFSKAFLESIELLTGRR